MQTNIIGHNRFSVSVFKICAIGPSFSHRKNKEEET